MVSDYVALDMGATGPPLITMLVPCDPAVRLTGGRTQLQSVAAARAVNHPLPPEPTTSANCRSIRERDTSLKHY